MKQFLKNLKGIRQEAHSQLRGLVNQAEREGRNLTATEQREFDKLSESLDELDARIVAIANQVDREDEAGRARAGAERFIRPAEDRGARSELGEQFGAFVRGEAGRSMEIDLRGISQRFNPSTGKVEIIRNDLLGGSGTGADVVPTSFRQQLYEHLIETAAVRQTNVTVLQTDTGEDLVVPKTTAHPTASWVAEGTAIGESDPTFGRGTLLAHKVGHLTQVTYELAQDNGVNLEAYLARAAGVAIGNASGSAFVTGDGSGKPTGFLGAGSVAVTGASAVFEPTADQLVDVWASVIPEARSRSFWLMSSGTWGRVRKLKNVQDDYLVDRLGAEGNLSLLGRPVVIDTFMPDVAADGTAVAFGDFSAYFIRDAGSLRIERSDDFAFDQDIVTLRFLARTDGRLIGPAESIRTYVGGEA